MPQRIGTLLLVLATLVSSAAHAQTAGTAITPGKTGLFKQTVPYNGLVVGQKLEPTQYLRSPNGAFALRYRVDGLLCLYSGSEVVWSSGVKSASPGRAEIQNGSLVTVQAVAPPVYWSTQTTPTSGEAFVAVLDDGNVMVMDAMRVLWDRNGYRYAPTTTTAITWKPTRDPVTTGDVGGVAYTRMASPFNFSVNEAVYSPSRKFALVYRDDGTFGLWDVARSAWKWTAGKPAADPDNGMFANGSLFKTATINGFRFTDTIADTRVASSFLAMRDDGTLVIYSTDLKPLWSK